MLVAFDNRCLVSVSTLYLSRIIQIGRPGEKCHLTLTLRPRLESPDCHPVAMQIGTSLNST